MTHNMLRFHAIPGHNYAKTPLICCAWPRLTCPWPRLVRPWPWPRQKFKKVLGLTTTLIPVNLLL